MGYLEVSRKRRLSIMARIKKSKRTIEIKVVKGFICFGRDAIEFMENN